MCARLLNRGISRRIHILRSFLTIRSGSIVSVAPKGTDDGLYVVESAHSQLRSVTRRIVCVVERCVHGCQLAGLRSKAVDDVCGLEYQLYRQTDNHVVSRKCKAHQQRRFPNTRWQNKHIMSKSLPQREWRIRADVSCVSISWPGRKARESSQRHNPAKQCV